MHFTQRKRKKKRPEGYKSNHQHYVISDYLEGISREILNVFPSAFLYFPIFNSKYVLHLKVFKDALKETQVEAKDDATHPALQQRIIWSTEAVVPKSRNAGL